MAKQLRLKLQIEITALKPLKVLTKTLFCGRMTPSMHIKHLWKQSTEVSLKHEKSPSLDGLT